MSLKFNLVFSLAAIATFGFSENAEAQIFRSGANCYCPQPVVRVAQPNCATAAYFSPAQSAFHVVSRPIFQNPIVGFHSPAPIVNSTVCNQPIVSAPIVHGPTTFDAPIVTEFPISNSFEGVVQPGIIYEGHSEPAGLSGVVLSDEGGVVPATFDAPVPVEPKSVEPAPTSVEPVPVPVKVDSVPEAETKTSSPAQPDTGSDVTEKSILNDGS